MGVASRRIAFVTGGSGFVGGRLIRALVSSGWEVRALARSQRALAAVSALGASPVQGDLNDRAALQMGMLGSDVVFHVAAHFKCGEPAKNSTKSTSRGCASS